MRYCVLLLLATMLLSACAGRLDYTRPATVPVQNNSVMVDKAKDVVWNEAVPALGKEFFVINNLDKSSGLINISYTGDPERYVDCGRVVSYVKNAAGERTYDFPGSRQFQQYEVMNKNGLFYVQREMSLEGRMNLIFEAIDSQQTRVTANTRYVLIRKNQVQSAAGGIPQSFSHSISINSGGRASFPPGSDGRALECVPTGKLEQDILSLIK